MSKIKIINHELDKIHDEIEQIVIEHDKCIPNASEHELIDMLNSSPIESLRDSLDFEHGKDKTKKRFSLIEMKKMSSLKKKKEKLIEKYLVKEHELKIAEIEDIQNKIKKII